MTFIRRFAAATIIASISGLAGFGAHAAEITVFAAASLTDALGRAAARYHDETGDDLRLSFASSSTLARQIAAGAPAALFISANEEWMDWLADQQLIDPASRADILANSLALIAPVDSAITTFDFATGGDLAGLIGANDRIAVGDPEHVPAGIYAKAALEHLGQWDALSPRLARADNVRAALALVESGETPLGIVYKTDAAIANRVRTIATFPADSHPAITYPLATITGQDSPAAAKLRSWLLGDDAAAIFAEYGFDRPQPATKAQ